MKFDITSKLKANEDPVLQVGDMELTVKTDAKTVLQLMEALSSGEGNDVEKLKKVQEILFSEGDRQKLLRIPFYNWNTLMEYAAQLAINGEIKAEEGKEPTGELTTT